MKKLLSVILISVLLLTLAACGGGSDSKEAPFDPAADASTLLASGCFSEELTEIDLDTACALYGIDRSTVTDGAVYGSTGVTGEELAILVLKDEEAAQTALKMLGYRVEDQTQVLAGYAPDAVAKLKEAVTARRESTVLLVIANDYGPIETFLGGQK